jgi:hypothetical protein
MASLRDLQYSFAAALRDPDAPCAVTPAANLGVYRNHGETQFRGVLAISFPVLRRRVGEDYFRQLAHHYRRSHPSRSGDLQWIGQHFAGFLASHLEGTGYAWLADLARLEWLRELASISSHRPPLTADTLGRYAPDQLERLVFTLQPSLGLLRSDFPVFSVWVANQGADAPPMDQSRGREQGLVQAGRNDIEVRTVEPAIFSWLSALAQGLNLGDAVAAAGLDEQGLLSALQASFAAELVCEVSLPQ